MPDPFGNCRRSHVRYTGLRAAIPGLLVLVISTVVAPWTATAGFGTCPSSQANMRNAGVATLEASVYDSTTTDAAGLIYHVSYNLPQGHVFAAQPGCLCGAWVEAVDLFDVTGVPSGTVVPLAAILTMDGAVTTPCGPGGCASVECRISSGVVQDTKFHQIIGSGSLGTIHDAASIPVTIVAGTPVEIRYYVHGQRSVGGDQGTTTTGLLSFSGQPNGAVIISCQGFTSARPTATRPTNWGALKAIYR